MEEPLVFALTPRGGRWNHRYLVPRNCNVSQRKLLAIAEQACSGQSPHVVSVSREVQQPASGRPGREILIATDSRLREKSSPLHQAVEDCLRQYLIPLKDLVDRIDWDTEGRQLIVERDELSAWREEVCGVMRLSQQSEDGRGSTRVARRSPRFDVRRMLTVPVLCLSLCCPLILVITWYFLPFFSDSVNGQHPPGSSRLHEIPETTPRGQMPPLTELAIAVGIPSPPDDRLELLGRIRDRLREDAYMEIGSESRRQNSRNAEDDQRKDLEREASIRHVETDLK